MDFDMLGLSPRLVDALEEAGLTDPTPIQKRAIPAAMEGRDVMGLAETGSGKTAAFGLPMIDSLLKNQTKAPKGSTIALVLAPTRELARQIVDALSIYTRDTGLRCGLVVGGAGITGQIRKMERGVHLLVATPGRLIDLLDRGAVSLDQTRFLVLDEADQMLDLGFIHALRRIAALLPAERQTMLFSATMPKQMAEVADAFLTRPLRIEVNPPGQAVDRIRQSVHFIAQGEKPALLSELLDAHLDDRALVFGRTKWGMEKLARTLEKQGFAVAAIHGAKTQGKRDRAIREFKEGKVRVLVATDVAARGLDIPDVKHVYNYELPDVPDTYVHRIGRTARAGADGSAVALCAPAEMGNFRAIEKLMKQAVPVASGRPWEVEAEPPKRGSKPGGKPGPGSRRRRPRRKAA